MLLRSSLVLVLALSSCAKTDMILELGEHDALLLFSVSQNQIVDQHLVLAGADAQLLTLDRDAELSVSVPITAEELESLVPDLDASRLGELEAAVLECDGRLNDARTHRMIRLPESNARIANFDENEWRAARDGELDFLALAVPVISKRCAPPGGDVLRSFGETEGFLPPGASIAGAPRADPSWRDLEHLERTSESVVLAASGQALFRFERGKAYSDVADQVVQISSVDHSVSAIAVDPRPNEPRRVLLGGAENGGPVLWEFWLHPTHLERSRTIVLPGSESPVGALAIDAAGRAFVASEEGDVWSESSSVAFSLTSLDGSTGSDASYRVEAMAIIEGSDEPHVLLEGGRTAGFYVGHADTGRFRAVDLRSEYRVDNMRLTSAVVRGVPGASELWVGGSDGLLLRGSNAESLEDVFPDPGPESIACFPAVQSSCELSRRFDSADGLAVQPAVAGGPVFVLGSECTALLALRPEDGCVWPLAPPGVKAARVTETSLLAVDAGYGWLTVSGKDGLLYELRLE